MLKSFKFWYVTAIVLGIIYAFAWIYLYVFSVIWSIFVNTLLFVFVTIPVWIWNLVF